MEWRVEGWYHRNWRPSIQILTDTFLQNWSTKDNMCRPILRSFAHLSLWVEEIRKSQVQLTLPITIIALQCTRQTECIEPLRNGIASLCRAIRCMSPGGRIFVTNNVPNPRSVPVLGKRAVEHNKLLFKAITGLQMHAVFYCDIAQHFLSKDGESLQPVPKYFTSEGDLTLDGCFIYRSCLLRETGVIPYDL